jgi:hypothetical protein
VRIEVDIERLVLEGIPATGRERDVLAAGLQHELALLLRDRSPAWPAHGVGVRRVHGGVVPAPTSGSAAEWTGAVAASVRDGMERAVEP